MQLKYTSARSPGLADEELAQVKVIEVYLPKQMSAEELEAALKKLLPKQVLPVVKIWVR